MSTIKKRTTARLSRNKSKPLSMYMFFLSVKFKGVLNGFSSMFESTAQSNVQVLA